MKSKKHRTNLRKRVIGSALAVITAMAAVDATSLQTKAIYYSEIYGFIPYYREIANDSVIDITLSEYLDFLRMTMAEAGHRSEEMMNGCASAAVNQCIQNEWKMEETLARPGAFSFYFRDSEGKWREVELSDINSTVISAANDALMGNDVTEEIGGAIGFFAPDSCSEEMAKYMYDHTSDGPTIMIENVIFFSAWK